MSESAWKWGGYRKGYGKGEFTDPRIKYAVLAIKKELKYLGYNGILVTSSVFGSGCNRAVKKFQKEYGHGLVVDGVVGQKTANALWSKRLADLGVANGWQRAQVHWESADDPGAAFINPDNSVDRGLTQVNSVRKPFTEEEAYDPEFALTSLADFLKDGAKLYRNCPTQDEWRLAVGRWRTPVGADDWCQNPNTQPSNADNATWAERAAYYANRVDTAGRSGWVG